MMFWRRRWPGLTPKALRRNIVPASRLDETRNDARKSGIIVMHCRRCRAKMQMQSHRAHKQEKWRCPQCQAVRMKPAQYRRQGSKQK